MEIRAVFVKMQEMNQNKYFTALKVNTMQVKEA